MQSACSERGISNGLRRHEPAASSPVASIAGAIKLVQVSVTSVPIVFAQRKPGATPLFRSRKISCLDQ